MSFQINLCYFCLKHLTDEFDWLCKTNEEENLTYIEKIYKTLKFSQSFPPEDIRENKLCLDCCDTIDDMCYFTENCIKSASMYNQYKKKLSFPNGIQGELNIRLSTTYLDIYYQKKNQNSKKSKKKKVALEIRKEINEEIDTNKSPLVDVIKQEIEITEFFEYMNEQILRDDLQTLNESQTQVKREENRDDFMVFNGENSSNTNEKDTTRKPNAFKSQCNKKLTDQLPSDSMSIEKLSNSENTKNIPNNLETATVIANSQKKQPQVDVENLVQLGSETTSNQNLQEIKNESSITGIEAFQGPSNSPSALTLIEYNLKMQSQCNTENLTQLNSETIAHDLLGHRIKKEVNDMYDSLLQQTNEACTATHEDALCPAAEGEGNQIQKTPYFFNFDPNKPTFLSSNEFIQLNARNPAQLGSEENCNRVVSCLQQTEQNFNDTNENISEIEEENETNETILPHNSKDNSNNRSKLLGSKFTKTNNDDSFLKKVSETPEKILGIEENEDMQNLPESSNKRVSNSSVEVNSEKNNFQVDLASFSKTVSQQNLENPQNKIGVNDDTHMMETEEKNISDSNKENASNNLSKSSSMEDKSKKSPEQNLNKTRNKANDNDEGVPKMEELEDEGVQNTPDTNKENISNNSSISLEHKSKKNALITSSSTCSPGQNLEVRNKRMGKEDLMNNIYEEMVELKNEDGNTSVSPEEMSKKNKLQNVENLASTSLMQETPECDKDDIHSTQTKMISNDTHEGLLGLKEIANEETRSANVTENQNDELANLSTFPTVERTDLQKKINSEIVDDSRYTCDIYNVGFSRKSKLESHKKIHDSKETISDEIVLIDEDSLNNNDDINGRKPLLYSLLLENPKENQQEASKKNQKKLTSTSKKLSENETRYKDDIHLKHIEEISSDSHEGTSRIEEINNQVTQRDGNVPTEETDIQQKKNADTVDNTRYACDICNVEFSRPSKLELHKKIHDLKEKVGDVAEKEVVIIDEDHLDNDDVSQSEDDDFTEDNFQSVYKKKNRKKKETDVVKKKVSQNENNSDDSTIENVESDTEEIPNLYQCEVCKKVFTTRTNLNVHKLNHGERIYECNICNFKFTYKRYLQKHAVVHSEERPFSCKYCGKSFKYKNYLIVHEKIHTGDKSYVCQTCGATFTHRAAWSKHIKRIHEDPESMDLRFACTKCDARFFDKSKLTGHQIVHSDERNFKCNKCDKAFKLKKLLVSHQIVHSDERKYECRICHNKFKRPAILQRHMISHTNERKFDCEICEHKSKTKLALKKHLFSHSTELKYQCDLCPKKFTAKFYLDRHRQYHFNKPYACDICEAKFTAKHNLTNHKRKHDRGLINEKGEPVNKKNDNLKRKTKKEMIETESEQDEMKCESGEENSNNSKEKKANIKIAPKKKKENIFKRKHDIDFINEKGEPVNKKKKSKHKTDNEVDDTKKELESENDSTKTEIDETVNDLEKEKGEVDNCSLEVKEEKMVISEIMKIKI